MIAVTAGFENPSPLASWEEGELAVTEEHLLWCQPCLDTVQDTEDYVDTIRVGLLCINGP